MRVLLISAIAAVLVAIITFVSATGVVEKPPSLGATGKTYDVSNGLRPRITCSSGMKPGWTCCGNFQYPSEKASDADKQMYGIPAGSPVGYFCCINGNGCPPGTTCARQPSTPGNDCLVGAGDFGRVNDFQDV